MNRYGRWAALGLCMLGAACSGDRDRRDTLDDGGSLFADGGRLTGDGSAGQVVDASGMDAALGMGGDGGADAGTTGPGTSPDGSSPFAINDAGQVLCGTGPCACSDGLDQDTDGLIDLADPECVSAWDNDEATFATGISGDNRDDACQDCFFDGNSGSGNDGCRIPSSCLTAGNPSSGQGSCNSCTASAQCKNFCQAYTPNGCDCFGCCGVQLGSNIVKNVLLSAGCSIDGNNLTGCMECVPSVSCVNTCGRCELCPGKTLADLPAGCGSTTTPGSDGGVPGGGDSGIVGGGGDAGTPPGPPTPTCDQGEARCGAGLPACAFDQSCNFGCCILTPAI